MPFATARTIRYVRTWLSDRARLIAEELELDREGTTVPATLVRPNSKGPWPAWIVLHGITRPGRTHAQLVRFTRALASTGCAVLVPEVPEWKELDLAPDRTGPTIRASMDQLLANPDIRGDRFGLVGFSFGSPQAVAAAGDPDIARHLKGVVGFGGYCDLERTIRFQFTGRHEWDGETHHLQPDPYGRWIVGANYLTSVPGYEEMDDVAHALRELAASAGDLGVVSWDPRFDADKVALGQGMAPAHRDMFDFFAPPTGVEPDPETAAEMAHALSQAAHKVDPEVEPIPRIDGVQLPVHIIHGRNDRLIPFSEGLRLARALPAEASPRATITPLFAHSTSDSFPGAIQGAKDAAVFLKAMRGVMGLV